MTAIIDQTAGSIIKSDRTGRAHYAKQYKQEVLDAFESSSLSAPAFARHCGIKYPTFAAWVARSKRAAHPEPTANPAFLVAEVAGAPDAPGLEVRLPGGAVLRAADSFQVKLLAELLTRLT